MYSSHIQPFHISDPSGSKELHLSPTISRSQSVCLSSSHSYINYTQVTRCISHIHPCPLSPPSKSLYWCLISIQVTSHLHLGHTSTWSRSSQHHLGANIPPFRFWGKLITSTHTASQLREAPYICISPPSKSSLIPDQILISVYHPQPGPNYGILE